MDRNNVQTLKTRSAARSKQMTMYGSTTLSYCRFFDEISVERVHVRYERKVKSSAYVNLATGYKDISSERTVGNEEGGRGGGYVERGEGGSDLSV